MPYLPCENPNCRSYGKSHPNCRCYGAAGNKYADGGEAKHFCSAKQAHNPDCEYFDGGGEAGVPDFDSLPKTDAAVPDFDSLPKSQSAPAQAENVPDFDQLPATDHSIANSALKYGEAAARGVFGFIPTAIETNVLGMDPKGIAQREADTSGYISPKAVETGAFAASLLSPMGPWGAMAHAIPETVAASKYLNMVIQGASIAGSNAIEQNLLGKGGSTADTVGQILAGGAGSVITGSLFNLMGAKLLNEKQVSAMANGSKEWLEGLAKKVSDKPVSGAVAAATELGTGYALAKHFGVSIKEALAAGGSIGLIIKHTLPFLQKIAGKALSGPDQVVGTAMLKALAAEKYGAIPTAINLGTKLANSSRKILPATEALMRAGAAKLVEPADEFLRSTLTDQVESGTLNTELQDASNSTDAMPQQAMFHAKGGEIKYAAPDKTDHLASVWPEHSAMLNTAKARIHTYLNSVRPLDNPKAAFDEVHKDREKERSYKHAIELAVNPLSILNHLNQSTLTPDILKHFVSLHPEVHGMLSNKISEAVIKEQLAGRKPPYSKRQSLSMFLGTDLDSVLSQPAIAAAQNVFATKQAAQQQQMQSASPPKKKSKTALSKISGSSLTQDQARAQRAQKV
jgi:hypothetical protein